MKFIQFSDTHLTSDIHTTDMKSALEQLPNAKEKFTEILANLETAQLDFITISGDLVHDGTADDYLELKQMLKCFLPNTPVLLALGNHDIKEPFHEVFTGNGKDERYYYEKVIRDYRIIVLDSAIKGEHAGGIDSQQLKWLKDRLSNDYGKGTLVIMHHPIIWENENLTMKNNKELIQTLTASDTIAIFSGHTHMNGLHYVGHIPQFTSEGIGFGLLAEGGQISVTNQCAYNIYSVEETFVNMKRVHIGPALDRVQTSPYDDVFSIK